MKPLTPLQKNILKWVGIPLFYVFCLVVFVRLTFPYGVLKNRILAEFNGSQTDKRLEIDDLSGSGLFGVEAEGVNLQEVTVQKAGEEAAAPLGLKLERASISVSPLAYLFGTISVSFDANVGGGELEGHFSQGADEAQIQVVGSAVDISELTLLGKSVGLPLGGLLGGEVELSLPEGKMGKAVGRFDLSIAELSVGDGKAKVRNTIALPKLNAGNLVLKAEAIDGRLELSEFAADGRDFEMAASGKLRMRQPFDRSTADIDVGFRFKEAYTQKSDLTKSLFGAADSKVPGLFDMDPTAKQAKGEDGFYSWRVTGLLGNPNFRPGKAGKPSSARTAKPAK